MTGNSIAKILEAGFFLRLMDNLERNRLPLLDGHDVTSQFSYLLSAFLGACYSAVAYLDESEHKAAARQFRQSHPDFYASRANGGWRTKAVHYFPVLPEHDGYIPPPGNQVNFRARGESYVPPRGDSANFDTCRHGVFYFKNVHPQCSICDLCSTHLVELKAFINSLPNDSDE